VANLKDDELSEADIDLVTRMEGVIQSYETLQRVGENENPGNSSATGWASMLPDIQKGYETLADEICMRHPHIMMVDVDNVSQSTSNRILSSCGNVK